jgi:hypothetical protein
MTQHIPPEPNHPRPTGRQARSQLIRVRARLAEHPAAAQWLRAHPDAPAEELVAAVLDHWLASRDRIRAVLRRAGEHAATDAAVTAVADADLDEAAEALDAAVEDAVDQLTAGVAAWRAQAEGSYLVRAQPADVLHLADVIELLIDALDRTRAERDLAEAQLALHWLENRP